MKATVQRSLCVMLTLCLLITTLVFSSAASEAEPGEPLSLWAPEAIYLYPNATSFRETTASPFQYYINNASDGSPLSAYGSKGVIYWSYPSASNASVSFRFVDQNMSQTLSGGSITLSETTLLGSSKVINITAGYSPMLAPDVTCCFIEWVVSYYDTSDNMAKKAFAYTCVYKPYTEPLAGGIRCKYDSGYAGSIAWLSGIHGIEVNDTWNTGYCGEVMQTDNDARNESRTVGYANWTGVYGLAGFISGENTGWIGNQRIAGTGSRHCADLGSITYASGATEWYTIYSGTDTSTAHINIMPNNQSACDYYAASYSTATFRTQNFQYNSADGEDYTAVMLLHKNTAKLTVDTSRYHDLREIPNLAVGLLVCDDEGSAVNTGSWYVASYTGHNGPSRCDGVDSARYKSNTHWNAIQDDKGALIASQIKDSSQQYVSAAEGLRYAGAWTEALDTKADSKTYSVKTMYTNSDGGYAGMDSIILDMNVTQVNKAYLRAAVQRATKAMAALGINGLNGVAAPTSCFYSEGEMATFQACFRSAVRALCSLETDNSSWSFAISLDEAINSLLTSRKSFEYSVVNRETTGDANAALSAIEDILAREEYYKLTPRFIDEPLWDAMRITLNSASEAKNVTNTAYRYFAFKPDETGRYVFMGLATDAAVDNRGCFLDEYGNELAFNDDVGATNNIADVLGIHRYQHKAACDLTAGKVYYVMTRLYSGTAPTTYSVKLNKAVTLTLRGTGGGPDEIVYKDMPAGHTLYPNAFAAQNREGHTRLAWSETGNSTQKKAFMANDTSLICPDQSITYWALWDPGSSAAALETNKGYVSTVSAQGQVNFYRFTPTETREYLVYSTGTAEQTMAADPFLILYDPAEWSDEATFILSDDDSGRDHPEFVGTTSRNFWIRQKFDAGKTYLFGVKAYRGTGTEQIGDLGDIPFRLESVYTVTYNANGGTGAPDGQSKYFNKSLTLSSDSPTREGFVFRGWSTTPDASEPTYAPDDVYTRNADITLYAVWAPMQFIVSSARARTGNQVQITITLQNNPGIVSAMLSLEYDHAKLALADVQESGILGEGVFTIGDDLTADPFIMFWANGSTHENIPAEGTLVTLTFDVKEGAASGVTPIAITPTSVFNVDLDAVPFIVQNGSIEIAKSVPGNVNDDGIVDLKDVVILTRYLAGGWNVTIDEIAADVNGDHTVDVKDAVLLRRCLAGWDITLV